LPILRTDPCYDPNLQRWINGDPIEEYGDLNLYRFAENEPIDVIDLFGLKDRKFGAGGIQNDSNTDLPIIDWDNKKCGIAPHKGHSPPKVDWDFVKLPNGKWYKIGFGDLTIKPDGTPAWGITSRPANPTESNFCDKVLENCKQKEKDKDAK
jgi:hypothetical protein